jgi:hypothetical protein
MNRLDLQFDAFNRIRQPTIFLNVTKFSKNFRSFFLTQAPNPAFRQLPQLQPPNSHP